MQSQLLSEIIVATDDERIASLGRACGVSVVMTDSDLASGTDRVFAAVRDRDCDAVVNIQGDEPLVNGEIIDRLAQVFSGKNPVDMATLAHPLDLLDLSNMNAVKVILNRHDEAIYFSRFAIPYSRIAGDAAETSGAAFRHIGMYAYTKKFLKEFCEAPVAVIEKAESLEQLRALYLGAKIKVLRVEEAGVGVDVPGDVAKVEEILRKRK